LPQLQHDVEDNILSIPNDIDVRPMWHPMNEAFWYCLGETAMDIRQTIDNAKSGQHVNTDDAGPMQWTIV